ncbi:MAG TPA: efflux RND transporter periplasmic adaptor subunit [Gemmatimonas aurantiaca]|uniref:Secretion protein HlyD family protein n=2 Tax=Gemmatimonas aurantiaca TaxID=173480 RepID=C1A9P7_GEMAT|nr:efflux RND transporter periplasmic adaptor subunit [Gemmatimonas aurantiaca]BAH39224.1 secretion protein HlyD family protein [Gemmatimonas aurantiaca T-27]HCT57522.1 efflux RND transporter periplasmic adaptor subunit [Gemmatimonas aurantiaca]
MTCINSSPWRALARRAGALLAVMTFCFVFTACESTDTPAVDAAETHAQEEAETPEHVQLDTTQIRQGGIVVEAAPSISSSTLAVTGTIGYDANRVSHVGSRTSGRVVTVRVDLGTRVSRGQALAILESPEVGQIRAEETEAQELVKIASENFAREQRLATQGISSRKELLDAEAELRRQQARLRSAESRLSVLGAGHGSDGQFAVTAPFDGVVVSRDASLGEMTTSQDTLFTVADLSRLWIELDIFERDLARVHEKQRVVVRTTAYPDRTFEGQISYVGPILDPARRTVRARIDVPNRDGLLRPGMFAEATIVVSTHGTPTVVLPVDAVQDMDGQKVVFVPGPKAGQFIPQPVVVGDAVDGGRVMIRSGLAVGAPVVMRGAFVLRSELAKGEIGEHGH